MKREILGHLIPALVFLLLVSLIHWQLKSSLIFFWLGGLLGSLFLDIDYLFYAYFQAPHELNSQRLKRFFGEGQFIAGINFLFESQEENRRLVFHSVLFQGVLLFASLFILTSSVNLFGKGLALGMFFHSLIDQAREFARGKDIGDWFWQFAKRPSPPFQIIYFLFIFTVFVFFSLWGI